jgi:RHS repeat-associated protein
VYDALNRLTQKSYPNSTSVEYTYDLVGKVLQVNDPTGTYGFSYDNMGRLIGTTTQYTFLPSNNFTNSYTYDANSNRLTLTDPQSGVTSYAYDTLNRLSTLTPPTAFSSTGFGFTYDALSRRTQMTRPNGVTTNYTYDNLSHLLSVLHQVSSSTIDGAAYTYDSAGNRTAKTNERTAVTSNYTYDPLYELTQVTQSTNTTESYSYDPVGNRLSSLSVSSYTNNSSNELTSTSAASYAYDANGNTTSKTASGNTTNYTWDYENRLISTVLPGTGGTVAFKYDPFGRRIYKSSTSGTSIYAYDGINLVEETNATGSAVARYSQGASFDDPLALLRGGTTSYYETDGLGSVTSLSSAAGSISNTYTFDSFGNQTGSTGSLVNPFRFIGREFDSETSLYYMRARYFDSQTGRFLSEDPLGFSVGNNFYTYSLDSPINLIDPAGLAPWPYDFYEKARKGLKKADCALSAAACQLIEDVASLDSMTADAVINTTSAQQNSGSGTAASNEGSQRLQLCLTADENCKNALEKCIKLALTNPFPPPSWLSDVINSFSKNPSTPAPPIKRK